MEDQFYQEWERKKSTRHINSVSMDQVRYFALVDRVKKLKNNELKKEANDYRLLKRFDVISVGSDWRLIAPVKQEDTTVRYYVTEGEMFEKIQETHLEIGHGGRDKMMKQIASKYANITRSDVQLYLQLCVSCQKNQKEKICRQKCKNLKDQFSRQKRSYELTADSGKTNKLTWTSNSFHEANNGMEVELDGLRNEYVVCTDPLLLETPSKISSFEDCNSNNSSVLLCKTRKRQRNENNSTDMLNEVQETFKKQIDNGNDEIDLFFNSLSQKTKKANLNSEQFSLLQTELIMFLSNHLNNF